VADELLRRAARAITDLRRLGTVLNDAGYPRDALRLQGFAGLLMGLEDELADAQKKLDARVLCESGGVSNRIAGTCIAAAPPGLIPSPSTREKSPSFVAATVRASSRRRGS
jgi:hypothetical protein